MTEAYAIDAVDPQQPVDRDSLSAISLSSLPIQTKALHRARLIKNSRLESVVELFSGSETGSAQIAPERLHQAYDFSQGNERDLDLVKAIAELTSFDVYSVRIKLRRMGIKANDNQALKLSPEKAKQLSTYMTEFTRPLILAVYEDASDEEYRFQDLVNLFTSPDMAKAKKNIIRLADLLEIKPEDLPKFLQDYGDVYLSLAYYQCCLDQTQPALDKFFDTLAGIKEDQHLGSNPQLVKICCDVGDKFEASVLEVKSVLDIFQVRTADMWGHISAERFGNMKKLITSYQTQVGGALCSITVKMDAWVAAFPVYEASGLFRRAEFITNEMRQGLQLLKPIDYADVG